MYKKKGARGTGSFFTFSTLFKDELVSLAWQEFLL
jgi:hypothetical protein